MISKIETDFEFWVADVEQGLREQGYVIDPDRHSLEFFETAWRDGLAAFRIVDEVIRDMEEQT